METIYFTLSKSGAGSVTNEELLGFLFCNTNNLICYIRIESYYSDTSIFQAV